jgi:phosphatidylglycerophosphate synthase
MQMQKQQIPWLMATGRALLGPVLVIGEKYGWNGFTLAALIVTALLSDIFDGILARRWGCDTAGVRLFDSMADTFFYAFVVVALWIGRPAVWASYRAPVLMLLALEAGRIGFDLIKFGKPASYHSYLAKTWGLVLAAAIVTVFAAGHAVVLLAAAIALGVACNVEGIAMSVMLPVWRRDVKTLGSAWQLRREIMSAAKNYAVSSAQRRDVVKRKPATGASASIESGLCSVSGSALGR